MRHPFTHEPIQQLMFLILTCNKSALDIMDLFSDFSGCHKNRFCEPLGLKINKSVSKNVISSIFYLLTLNTYFKTFVDYLKFYFYFFLKPLLTSKQKMQAVKCSLLVNSALHRLDCKLQLWADAQESQPCNGG